MADPTTGPNPFLARHVWRVGQHHAYITRQMKIIVRQAGTDFDDIARAVEGAFVPLLLPLVSSRAIYLGTWCMRLAPSPLQPDGRFLAGDVAGHPDRNLLPPGVAPLLRFELALHPRRGEGRMYIPFAPESACLHGRIAPWYQEAMQLCATWYSSPKAFDLTGIGTPTTIVPGVWTGGAGLSWFSNGLASPVFATQRRRAGTHTPTRAPFPSGVA